LTVQLDLTKKIRGIFLQTDIERANGSLQFTETTEHSAKGGFGVIILCQ